MGNKINSQQRVGMPHFGELPKKPKAQADLSEGVIHYGKMRAKDQGNYNHEFELKYHDSEIERE